MHYAFDTWMARTNPDSPFERYSDDVIIHCKTESEAYAILGKLNQRMKECKLELHPKKTKIIYCKDKDRTKEYPITEFDFLGYTFRRIFIKDSLGRLQFNFLPSVSKKSTKGFRDKIKAMRIHRFTGSKIEIIAEVINPTVRGWLNYFTRYNPSAVKYSIDCVNRRLVKWAMSKYKRFRGHRKRAEAWLKELARKEPKMFSHWALGMIP